MNVVIKKALACARWDIIVNGTIIDSALTLWQAKGLKYKYDGLLGNRC